MDNPVVSIVLDTINLSKQAIVFAESKASAEKAAEDIASKLPMSQDGLAKKIGNVLSPSTRQCDRLARCVKKGVAFHHSGLVAKQRELIEQNFRDGNIKVIASTPTLAVGVDLPAFRAIMKSLKRFSPGWGMVWIPVLEYQQMSGRAGRPSYDAWGEAISVAKSFGDRGEIERRYIFGEVEKITSKLAAEPVLRTVVLSVIATGFVSDFEQLLEFFSKTFWAHQYGNLKTLKVLLEKTVDLLISYEFISSSGGEFAPACALSKQVLRSTVLGGRVAELYLDPLTAFHLVTCLKNVEKITEFGLLQMISFTLEMRPLLRVKIAEYEWIQTVLLENYGALMMKEPVRYDSEYDFFLNSVKTACFLSEWTDEASEDDLLKKFRVRPGEIHAKIFISDWLLYTSQELARILKLMPFINEISKLRLRVKRGIKEELLPLIRFKNVGRVRARKLFNNQLKDVRALKKISLQSLQSLVGVKTAQSIKEQLG